jgi:hypothetical protein
VLSKPTTDTGDHTVIRTLLQACDDFTADPVERLALIEAAIVARGLRPEETERDGRIGVLAQGPAWGPAPARRDPYTAAMVFLKEARRVRTAPSGPRRASRLAARVQGTPGAWRHACACRMAKQTLTRSAVEAWTQTVELPVPATLQS